MSESGTGSGAVRLDEVDVGEASSRLSRTIFVLICTIPVVSCLLFGAVDNGTWILITTLSAIVFLLWLAEEWRAGGFIISTSSIQLPLIGLMVIGVVQIIPLGGGALSLDPFATQLFIFRLGIYLAFLAACLTFINSERRVRNVTLLLVIFGSLMGFYGILQRLTNPDGIYGLRATPMSVPFGSFVNQHHFASFMQMTAGVALSLLAARSTRRDKRLLLGIAVALMGTAAVLTSSRGGMIGFIGAIVFVLMANIFSPERSGRAGGSAADEGPRRKIILAASGAAVILLIFGIVFFLGESDSLIRGIGLQAAQTDVSNGRSHFWPIALKVFFNNPVLGSGFETFGDAYTRFDSWNGSFRVEQAHNDYLQILADSGLVGFSCAAAYIYLLFRKGFAVIARSAGGFRRNAAIGALAGSFGVLIHSFFDFPLRTPSNGFFFLLLTAIATVTVKAAHPSGRRTKQG